MSAPSHATAEAENALIGALLLEPGPTLEKLRAAAIGPASFADVLNGLIFAAAEVLHTTGQPVRGDTIFSRIKGEVDWGIYQERLAQADAACHSVANLPNWIADVAAAAAHRTKLAEARKLVEAAAAAEPPPAPAVPPESEEATFARLAKLSLTDYDRARKVEAARLKIRPTVLDKEVTARRTKVAATAAPAGPAKSKNVEPWPHPVDGAALLDDLRATFKRFLILPAGAAEVLPLWVLHTYVFPTFYFTPYLNVASATRRSGKTTLLELLAELVCGALLASGVSPASIFRIVEARKPTLLIDEFDALPDETREALRGVLNSGFKRGGSFIRCVGDDHVPTEFSTFCPKALSGIGDLSDTVADRAIRVTMTRKTKGERVERYRRFDGTELRRRCLRWANDHQSALADAEPVIPDQLNDRQQDIAEPLLAVADLAGADWPRLAREALLTLLDSGPDDDQESLNVLLLADLRQLFDDTDEGKVFSKTLAVSLKEIDDRPWAGMNKGNGVSPHQISRMLKQFGIGSRSVWCDGKSAKGYDLDDCRDAFERYLSGENTPAKRQNVKPPANIERNEDFGNVSTKSPDVSENVVPSNKDRHFDVLTFPNAVLQEELL